MIPPADLLHPDGSISLPKGFRVGNVNRALNTMGYKMTTNSFRRLFSRRIEPYCEANEIAKALLLGHKDTTMDQAFYSW